MNRWAHRAVDVDPVGHPVDPHYQVNGKPSQWVCWQCREPISLDGKAPPITADRVAPVPSQEPSMAAQP